VIPRPSNPLLLADDEVQVWAASLNFPAEDMEVFAATLAPDEQARAARFVFERDRQHYIAGRGLLRMLLADHVGIEPANIVFSYGPHGKPTLPPADPDRVLEFNLAHSRDLALYAFGWNRQIGIDLEHIQPMPDEDDFAERFFSVNEIALLAALSGDRKTEAFFKIWTCKEAILKAIGSGLSKPLSQTEVAWDHEGSIRIMRVDGDQREAAHWQLLTFEPAPGYHAALVGEWIDWKLVLMRLEGSLNGPENPG
jgi:4'-phosphopantetheinyl transferase